MSEKVVVVHTLDELKAALERQDALIEIAAGAQAESSVQEVDLRKYEKLRRMR